MILLLIILASYLSASTRRFVTAEAAAKAATVLHAPGLGDGDNGAGIVAHTRGPE